jgi:hypothetical protein
MMGCKGVCSQRPQQIGEFCGRSGPRFFSGIRGRLRGLFAGPLSPTLRIDTLGLLTQLLAPSIGDRLPGRYFTAATP